MSDDPETPTDETSDDPDAPTTEGEGAAVADVSRLRAYYDENPYAVLAAAAGAGYAVGGGLFTPFTKRLLRVGMKAVVVPAAISQIEELTQQAEFLDRDEAGPDER